MKTTLFKTWTQHRLTGTVSSSLLSISIVVLIIGLSPFIYYLYKQFPKTNVWETAYFVFESHGFRNVYTLMWTLMGKFLPILLLSIWAITSRESWWRVIMIPIIMYVFQLVNIFLWDQTVIDEKEWILLIPISIIVYGLLTIIRKKTIKDLILLDVGQRISEAKIIARSILENEDKPIPPKN